MFSFALLDMLKGPLFQIAAAHALCEVVNTRINPCPYALLDHCQPIKP
jgi:hypothetical protein